MNEYLRANERINIYPIFCMHTSRQKRHTRWKNGIKRALRLKRKQFGALFRRRNVKSVKTIWERVRFDRNCSLFQKNES